MPWFVSYDFIKENPEHIWLLLVLSFLLGVLFSYSTRRFQAERKKLGAIPRQHTSFLQKTEGYISSSDDEEGSDDEDEDPMKMVLVVRTDLNMTKGKAAAQCCHACLAAFVRTHQTAPELISRWRRCGQAKVTLRLDLQATALSLGLVAESICDAGRTQIAPGSRTVLAIGPAPASKINAVTGRLKLY